MNRRHEMHRPGPLFRWAVRLGHGTYEPDDVEAAALWGVGILLGVLASTLLTQIAG